MLRCLSGRLALLVTRVAVGGKSQVQSRKSKVASPKSQVESHKSKVTSREGEAPPSRDCSKRRKGEGAKREHVYP